MRGADGLRAGRAVHSVQRVGGAERSAQGPARRGDAHRGGTARGSRRGLSCPYPPSTSICHRDPSSSAYALCYSLWRWRGSACGTSGHSRAGTGIARAAAGERGAAIACA
eukprot:3905268-Rhodomonas_salina.2